MAIAGKPGGLVVEGRESDVISFMNLMRTEFFETLNPRGRKLTTRLQERWPLDDEMMRYNVAKARKNIIDDIHQSVKRSNEIVNKVINESCDWSYDYSGLKLLSENKRYQLFKIPKGYFLRV